MIVDDQKGVRRLLETVFREDGWQVDAVSNGQEALERVVAVKPNLIIMDVRMPNQSGLDAARQIRQQVPIPIIMMTAYSETDIVNQALAAGVEQCITKPFDIAQLRAMAAPYRS